MTPYFVAEPWVAAKAANVLDLCRSISSRRMMPNEPLVCLPTTEVSPVLQSHNHEQQTSGGDHDDDDDAAAAASQQSRTPHDCE